MDQTKQPLEELAVAAHERRLAEEERRGPEPRSPEALALESLRALAAGIAREFNDLLVGILANAEMVRDELPAGSTSRESLADIELAARRAADLCDRLRVHAGAGAAEVPAPVEDSRPGIVLLVDDDTIVRTVGKQIIKRAGFEVLTACDGVDGLEQFREHRDQIACIVLDLTMPRMGGEQMLRELRLIDGRVPVVLCSGHGEQEIIGGFADQTLAGFVEKPYDKATLLAAVRGAIASRPSRE